MPPIAGYKLEQLQNALIEAYPSEEDLAMMLRQRLDKRLAVEAGSGKRLDLLTFKLLERAEAKGYLNRLVVAAMNSNPGNVELFKVAQLWDAVPHYDTPSLERLIVSSNGFVEIDTWIKKLGSIQGQVCRVEASGGGETAYGTGFLVGPDLVITNYHVLANVILGHWAATDVALRFDYKELADKTVNQGTVFHLDAKWNVDASPHSAVDGVSPKPSDPDPDELDYVVLRVKGSPGKQAIGGSAEPGAAKRGWLVPSTFGFSPDSPLQIVQHPEKKPIKLAIETRAVIGRNGNGTRVFYRVNTEAGSSGSPVFNQEWELVALHHSGDPNYDPEHKPTFNEGIPFDRIVARLARPEIGLTLTPPPV